MSSTSTPHLPEMKRYSTILADPPWDILQKGGRGAMRHYPVMRLDAVKALRVDRLAMDNSHCWLWVTNATVHAGEEVLAAWGFTYRSILTWIKPRLGLGHISETKPNIFCSVHAVTHRFSSEAKVTGSTRRNRNTVTSPRSSTRSSRGARQARTWNCLLDGSILAGTPGATRSTVMWRCE